jgi:hypothetical protein
MKRYEYKSVSCSKPTLVAKLNEEGRQGWRVLLVLSVDGEEPVVSRTRTPFGMTINDSVELLLERESP